MINQFTIISEYIDETIFSWKIEIHWVPFWVRLHCSSVFIEDRDMRFLVQTKTFQLLLLLKCKTKTNMFNFGYFRDSIWDLRKMKTA